MTESKVLTFYASRATAQRLEKLTQATKLSRSALLGQLIQRAELRPVLTQEVGTVSVAEMHNGSAPLVQGQRAAVAK